LARPVASQSPAQRSLQVLSRINIREHALFIDRDLQHAFGRAQQSARAFVVFEQGEAREQAATQQNRIAAPALIDRRRLRAVGRAIERLDQLIEDRACHAWHVGQQRQRAGAMRRMREPHAQRRRHPAGEIWIIREDQRQAGERPLYFIARMAGDDDGFGRL